MNQFRQNQLKIDLSFQNMIKRLNKGLLINFLFECLRPYLRNEMMSFEDEYWINLSTTISLLDDENQIKILMNKYHQKAKQEKNYVRHLYQSIAHAYHMLLDISYVELSLNYLIKYAYYKHKDVNDAIEERLRQYQILLNIEKDLLDE